MHLGFLGGKMKKSVSMYLLYKNNVYLSIFSNEKHFIQYQNHKPFPVPTNPLLYNQAPEQFYKPSEPEPC